MLEGGCLCIGPKSSWFEITDDLPRMSGEQLVEYRRSIGFDQTESSPRR